jgi:hypothetical protein
MKRAVLIILLVCCLVPYSEGQVWKLKRYNITAGIGTAQMFGDIGGFSNGKNLLGLKDFSIRQHRFDLNFSVKYRLAQFFNARVNLNYAYLHASDVVGSNEARGLESRTSLFETSLLGEYYFIKNRAEKSFLFNRVDRDFLGFLDFYAFSGIGAAIFSTSGNAELVSRGLAPGGVTPVVPIGLGGNLIFSPDLNFGIELGTRFSFTDNLDGYDSQYSNSNDVYYFVNFTLTYKLKTGANKLPSFR